MHKDESDIKDGLAGVLQFGDAHGGFFAFPHWRLLLETKSGCAQLFNFARLNTDWDGFFRDVLVYATGEGPRGYAHKLRKTPLPQAPDSAEDERKLAAYTLASVERNLRARGEVRSTTECVSERLKVSS